jgi:signal peptidase I
MAVETQAPTQPRSLIARYNEVTRDVHRGFIAEWTVTIVLLLFGMTTLVQAFVIPSASMEDTLLIGDHVLVDKLLFAPSGPVSKHILPYRDVRRGDVIVFRYPLDIREDYVKRAIGVPGDHIRLVNKQLILNGHPVDEPYVVHKTSYIDSYRDNFPSDPNGSVLDCREPRFCSGPGAPEMLEHHVIGGEVVVPPGFIFAMGDNRDNSLDSRVPQEEGGVGFVPSENLMARADVMLGSYDFLNAHAPVSWLGQLRLSRFLRLI